MLTLGGIERSNQGHSVFIGLCIIDNVFIRQRSLTAERHLVLNNVIVKSHSIDDVPRFVFF